MGEFRLQDVQKENLRENHGLGQERVLSLKRIKGEKINMPNPIKTEDCFSQDNKKKMKR